MKNNTAYDESYDLDKAIVEKKAEQKKIEAEKKQAQEAAKQRKKEQYEKQLAEQQKQREEALKQKRQKDARIAALKAEYNIPTKTLTNFEILGTNNKKVKGEIKDTEILWITDYISLKKSKKKNLWFGKIHNVQIIDRTERLGKPLKNPCFLLKVNYDDLICGDKSEIHRIYNELINEISLWYDIYSELYTKKPSFLSNKISVKENVEANPPSPTDKLLVINIQKQLKALGYYKGEIDGIFGGGTASAITAYQQDSNLKPDGMPSKELLAHLEARVNNFNKPKQNEIAKETKKPQTLEETVNKTVDGLLKAIFKKNNTVLTYIKINF